MAKDTAIKTNKSEMGTQDIEKRDDYGARAEWAKAEKPASVEEMVGPRGEFAKYKHDQA